LAEYRGLIREQTVNARLMAVAADLYQRIGEPDSARVLLEQAYRIEPSGVFLYLLGTLELAAKRYAEAVSRFEEARRYAPDNPPLLFDLSRAHALAGDRERARYYADRLAALNPNYPGLAEWRAMLGTLQD